MACTPFTENKRQFSQTLSFLCFFSWPTQKKNQKSSLPLSLLNHSKLFISVSFGQPIEREEKNFSFPHCFGYTWLESS
jgi:hypothetical protein